MSDLTRADCTFILTTLDFTRRAFEEYGGYPTHEGRQERLAELATVTAKVRALRNTLPPVKKGR